MAYFIEIREAGSDLCNCVNLDRVNRFFQSVNGQTTVYFADGSYIDVSEPLFKILAQVPESQRARQEHEK